MNIENWSIEKKMQLPEWCYGTKYVISAAARILGVGPEYDISELSFPDVAVIWQVAITHVISNSFDNYFRVGLAMQIPTTAAEMNQSMELLPGYGTKGSKPRIMNSYSPHKHEKFECKIPIKPQGRKLVVEVVAVATKEIAIRMAVVVSSIPKEVPDWVVSGIAGVRM